MSAVLCQPACLRVRRSIRWPGPPTGTHQRHSTAAVVLNPPRKPHINDTLHLPHQQPQPSPMASTKNPNLAIIHSLRGGLELDREYRHSRPQREGARQYVDIVEEVNHHREMEEQLRALGYEHAWQRKRWPVWRDSGYVADFSPDLHQGDRPAEEPSAPSLGKDGPDPRAAALDKFTDVA